MQDVEEDLHIYQRTIDNSAPDSLSLIAEMIRPGQVLLDLGMGTGALGQYLSNRHPLVADGVTYNPAEADIARNWYRRAVVADLDHYDLSQDFALQSYDCIVCADVLEHLKSPQRVLEACKRLLKPDGRLLVSIPNAAYCGLLAELLQGDFRYRPEGLLDETHLRFFTRKSLNRFFNEHGWTAKSTRTTQRPLSESEFSAAFDDFPPAVARFLLAIPDALTYQFIWELQPTALEHTDSGHLSSSESIQGGTSNPAQALFSSQLYLATHDDYNEARKLVVCGRIGDSRQTLIFNIPPNSEPYTRLRLDPADRPAFLRLHHLLLRRSDSTLAWEWQAGTHPIATLSETPQQQMVFLSAWEPLVGSLVLLHGDDPWFELPVTSELLQEIARDGATLEIGMGWPMSADYIQASNAAKHTELVHGNALSVLREQISNLQNRNTEIERNRLTIQAELEKSTQNEKYAQNEKQQLRSELRASQQERNLHKTQINQLISHLQSIEQSSLFRSTRPLVRAKMRMDQLFDRSKSPAHQHKNRIRSQPIGITRYPVDIIIPVYKGLEDTRRCVESVLAASSDTPWGLTIINDCSPEPEVTEWLRAIAHTDPRIHLLENSENLGFVATVNRGMKLSRDNDVLLLNSDTEVANDWLARLQQAAYSEAHIASVTPFSNNATIFSYPRFCQPNEMPNGYDTASLDHLCATHLAGQTLEVPTGVGFCMYLRRACLEEVGLFDVENFGKGYGEENDFCVRAQQAGWKHLHALDTFVRHAGGISFGDSKSERELQAMDTLRRLHPTYEKDVHDYVLQDPASTARLTIDIARITNGGRPVILNVTHNRQGGTLRHVQELAQRLGKLAVFLQLSTVPGGVLLKLEGKHEAFALYFGVPLDIPNLLATLRELQVSHIHYHHLLGHSHFIEQLPEQLGVTHDFTVHDYYSYCPQISLTDHTDRYCGEQGLDQCRQCVKRSPAPKNESIDQWRERNARLLSRARYVIAPSEDTAQRMRRFVPSADIRVAPHSALDMQAAVWMQPTARPLHNHRALKIIVLGALSKIKGADILEAVAMLAARHRAPIEFHLLGYGYRTLRTLPKARLTVHGSYEDNELPELLRLLEPDLIWFPAQWPETYSYTLSASIDSGLPIVVPNIGAFPERLQNRDWTWQCDWKQTPAEWLAFFQEIRTLNFIPNTGPQALLATSREPGSVHATLNYRGDYLEALSKPVQINKRELLLIQTHITSHLYQPSSGNAPSARLKFSALRALARLRVNPALSPLTRLVPTHIQRRIKSWLAK